VSWTVCHEQWDTSEIDGLLWEFITDREVLPPVPDVKMCGSKNTPEFLECCLRFHITYLPNEQMMVKSGEILFAKIQEESSQ
jgi:hypothetical protein